MEISRLYGTASPFMEAFALCLLLLYSGASSLAISGEIFTWIDEEGITHYSDQPSVSGPRGAVNTLQIKNNPNTSTPRRDYHVLAEQAKRLEEDRLEREKIRLTQKETRLRNAQRRRSQLMQQRIELRAYPPHSHRLRQPSHQARPHSGKSLQERSRNHWYEFHQRPHRPIANRFPR